MTFDVSRLPLSLDPLIAEAKRRARARRLLLVVLAVVASGLAAATLALRGSERVRPLIIAPGACRITQLNVVPGPQGAAAGTASRAFALVNASEASCTLRGWPRLRLRLGNGSMVSPRVEHDHFQTNKVLPVRTVKLAPGGLASFRVMESDGTGTWGSCRAVTALVISLPGAGGRVDISKGAFYCAPYILSELPLVAGRINTFAGTYIPG